MYMYTATTLFFSKHGKVLSILAITYFNNVLDVLMFCFRFDSGVDSVYDDEIDADQVSECVIYSELNVYFLFFVLWKQFLSRHKC